MICNIQHCTGCGMCSNVCPYHAITMEKGLHGFIYPTIHEDLCTDCHLCEKVCPANAVPKQKEKDPEVYAAWNKNKKIRRQSTSGGVFTALADYILQKNGAVVGVRWADDFHAEHCVIEDTKDLHLLWGSKYVQSDTGVIYKKVKDLLKDQKYVLFTGTPCQNHALQQYLRKDYEKLFQVDLICHGVPSQEMFARYQKEIDSNQVGISDIRLRYKNPYWDYANVRVDFKNGQCYQRPTMDDAYFNLFNVGYSLRESCHHCRYTSVNRCGDITLADFWGYHLNSFQMRDYQKGVSLILVNTEKGEKILSEIKTQLVIEKAPLVHAVAGNKSLKEPYQIDPQKEKEFWKDYEAGMTVVQLDEKYTKGTFHLPNLLFLRRLKKRWGWVKNHGKFQK